MCGTSCAAVSRKGLRLHGAVSDNARDAEICFILERCRIRTIAERLGSHRQMTSVRQHEGAFLLLKTPGLVLPDLDAPRSFTIVDIKVVDPAAASYVCVDMTYPNLLSTGTEPRRMPAPANT